MTPLKIFSLALRRRLQTKKKSGPENNRSLAKKLRQKPNDDKNISIESISIYNRIISIYISRNLMMTRIYSIIFLDQKTVKFFPK